MTFEKPSNRMSRGLNHKHAYKYVVLILILHLSTQHFSICSIVQPP